MGVDAVAQKTGFVLKAAGAEHGYGIVNVDGALFNGQRLGGELPHPGLYPFQQSLIRRELPLGAAEQSVAQGELHGDSLRIFPAYRIIKGFQHQQNGTALIGLASGLVGGGDEGQCAVPVQYFVQLPELAVPVYQQNIVGNLSLMVGSNDAKRRPGGVLASASVYGDVQHGLFHSGSPSNIRSRI